MSDAQEVPDLDRAMTSTERARRSRARRQADGIPRVRTETEKRHKKARRQTDAGKEARRREKRAAFDRIPFMGCDGEGCGTDDKGRQNYMVFRMGDRELFTGQPLTTREICNFILDGPSDKDAIKVGFSFGYDVTQILRNIPSDRWKELFKPRVYGPGHSPYTWFGSDIGIDYLPRNFLRIVRMRRISDTHLVPIEGTARTIFESFGFFQMSFVRALDAFNAGTPDQRAMIAHNKDMRGEITEIDQETRDYCQLECDLLAAMMTTFRTICIDNQIYPREWSGAGKISEYLHRRYKTMTAEELEQLVQAGQIPKAVIDWAGKAYYGGRFEVSRIGEIPGPIYNYDINSAYPDAMRRLPCLRHGTWEQLSGPALRRLHTKDPDALTLADVHFFHLPTGYGQLCGLPIRHKSGRIYWPREGNGIYWSCEIASAEKLGAEITYKSGWRYHRHCDCVSFAWTEPLYTVRKSLEGLMGYPYKLGLNGSYGKLAQRIGSPKYANPIHASLITAMVRARLNEAAAPDPTAIAMFATDGILSVRPLPHLDRGEGLGQWDAKEHDRVFVVQPGIYWGPRDKAGSEKRKTRGISPRFLDPAIPKFQWKWAAWVRATQRAYPKPHPNLPVVPVKVELFIGLKLARNRRKPDLAGCWIGKRPDDAPRHIRFDWTGKRGRAFTFETDGGVVTTAQDGHANLVSVYHADIEEESLAAIEMVREELEDQPDFVEGMGFD
jgi:DNA polymerase type B, organellar and viral